MLMLALLGLSAACPSILPASVCVSILPYTTYSASPSGAGLSTSGPELWSALLLANASHAAVRLATIMCRTAYPPCDDVAVDVRPCRVECQGLLNATVASPAAQTLISAFSPSWLNCSSDIVYSPSNACSPTQVIVDPAALAAWLVPRCATYGAMDGGVCDGVIDPSTSYYLPPLGTRALFEMRLQPYLETFRLAPVAPGCRDRLAQVVCRSAFLACDPGVLQRTTGLALGVPFPRFPCLQTCIDAQPACGTSAENATHACTTASTISPPLLDYPNTTTVFGYVGGAPLSTACVAAQNDASPTSVTCPAPLLLAPWPVAGVDNAVNGGSCSTPCYNIVWSDAQWAVAETLLLVCATLSMAGTTVALATWACAAKRRRQQHTLLMFMLCEWLLALAFFFGSWLSDRPRDIGCRSTTASSSLSASGVAVLQGAVIQFAVLASVSWWLSVVWHLFTQVVLERRWTDAQTTRWNGVYHTLSWGVAGVLTVTALAQGQIGRGSSSPWILFRDGAADGSFYASEFALFYAPILLQGTIGVLLMAVVLGTLARHRLRVARSGDSLLSSLLRPSLFVLLFLVLVCFLCTYRLWMFSHQVEYTASAKA